MQRRDSALVQSVRIRSAPRKKIDRLRLRSGFTTRSANAVARIMKRLSSTPIPSTDARSPRNQRLDELAPVRRCREMQRCITRVSVVLNFRKEMRDGVSPRRADLERSRCELGSRFPAAASLRDDCPPRPPETRPKESAASPIPIPIPIPAEAARLSCSRCLPPPALPQHDQQIHGLRLLDAERRQDSVRLTAMMSLVVE